MKSKILSKLNTAIFIILSLALSFGLSSCSDDEKDNLSHYALQINGQSLNYASNSALNAKIKEILEQYCPANPGFIKTDLTTATQTWQKACNKIRTYDWDKSNIIISDSTYMDLALVVMNKLEEGNTVINRYKITFPYFVYRFIVSNESKNYSLNIKAQTEVNKIIAKFGKGKDNTFKGSNEVAILRFNSLVDSIGKHNWRNNELAIQKNCSFKLTMVFGTYIPKLSSTVVKEQDITLPNH